jgi:hypothetical protein
VVLPHFSVVVVGENGINKLRKKKNRKKSTRIRDRNGEERKINRAHV